MLAHTFNSPMEDSSVGDLQIQQSINTLRRSCGRKSDAECLLGGGAGGERMMLSYYVNVF